MFENPLFPVLVWKIQDCNLVKAGRYQDFLKTMTHPPKFIFCCSVSLSHLQFHTASPGKKHTTSTLNTLRLPVVNSTLDNSITATGDLVVNASSCLIIHLIMPPNLNTTERIQKHKAHHFIIYASICLIANNTHIHVWAWRLQIYTQTCPKQRQTC